MAQPSDIATALIHHPYRPAEGFAATQPGVFKASTVFFPNMAAVRSTKWTDKSGYTYGVHGTPTTYMLEERLCALEGDLYCQLSPSGLAAIAHVALAFLRTGDEVLIPENAYGPNKALAAGELSGWGIRHRFYKPMDPQDLAASISPATRLVWLEAPGSITMEFPDLPALVRVCREHGVLCVLDNTWGAGLAFAPFDLLPGSSPGLGVDISVHALTKYPSGGGDVLMGSVITRDAALHRVLQTTHMRLGLSVGANDAETILRSLPSIALRYAAHDASARQLARWCQSRPEFSHVLHPALPGSPGHQAWQALCKAGPGGAAGLFSVMVDARFSRAQVDAFCDALQLFKLGYSWGGAISLAMSYELAAIRSDWPSALRPGTVVRFSIGLESAADLQDDLEQALHLAFA